MKEISTLKIDTFCGVFGLGGVWLYFVWRERSGRSVKYTESWCLDASNAHIFSAYTFSVGNDVFIRYRTKAMST
jgi:hypothetical protein